MSKALNCVRLSSKSGLHKYSVIWLHGLGDSSEGFRDVFQNLLSVPKDTDVLLANAPVRPITINGGMKMQAWYDIYDLGKSREDEKGVEESRVLLTALLDEELEKLGGDAKKIVLGGFSMGGAMSLFTGLQYHSELGGVISCSGYVPTLPRLLTGLSQPNTSTLLYHGDADPMVPVAYAQEHYTQLRLKLTGEVESHVEPRLEHSLSLAEIKTIETFINKQLK